MSTRREIRERWGRILREQPSSGLSVAAFCRQAGVPYSGFYKWRDKFGDRAGFAEVRLKAVSVSAVESERQVSNAGEIELRLPGQRSIVVRRGFDGQTLRELLEVLEAGSFATAGREAER